MGNEFSSGNAQGGGNNNQKDKDGEKKRKWEPPVPPPRVGRKQKKREASNAIGGKLPVVTPSAKCKLRLLKLERVKDYLLMEEEFVANQVCTLSCFCANCSLLDCSFLHQRGPSCLTVT